MFLWRRQNIANFKVGQSVPMDTLKSVHFEQSIAWWQPGLSRLHRRNVAMFNNYRTQTKLREGNVFTGVCDSVHRGGAGGAWSQGAAPGGECLVLVGVCSGRRIAWSWGCLVRGGAWSRGMCLVLGGVCSRVVPGGDPPESYCCGRYASYWNAFLLFHIFLILEKSNHSFSS